MLEVLIREAAARFGVGDKAQPLVQMLLATMTDKDTGGLAGFLEKFKVAGLGPLVQSWLGGGDGAQPLANTQIETVLGASGGLLASLSAQLGLPRDQITSAIGYLLPALVGRLTPGGNLPASLPPDIASYVQAGQGLLSQAAQAVQTMQRANTGGGPRWLVWIVVIVVVLAALYAWRASQHGSTPGAGAPSAPPAVDTSTYNPLPTPHTQPPTPGAAFGGGGAPSAPPASAVPPAPAAAPVASETSAPASAPGSAASPAN